MLMPNLSFIINRIFSIATITFHLKRENNQMRSNRFHLWNIWFTVIQMLLYSKNIGITDHDHNLKLHNVDHVVTQPTPVSYTSNRVRDPRCSGLWWMSGHPKLFNHRPAGNQGRDPEKDKLSEDLIGWVIPRLTE